MIADFGLRISDLRKCAWLAAVVALAILTPAEGWAECGPRRVRRSFVVRRPAAAAFELSSGLTIVPFAVPVAVPVAVVQQPTLLYAYSAYGRSPYTAAVAKDADAERALPVPQSEIRNPKSAISRQSAISRHCVSCHGGGRIEGVLDLSDLAALDTAARLAAVARVVSDDAELRMPRGATLPGGEIGSLVQELSEDGRGPRE